MRQLFQTAQNIGFSQVYASCLSPVPLFLFPNSQLIPNCTKHCVFTRKCNLCVSRPIFSMNKFRFRNHISTLPQPNFGDSATKIRHASATKKRRFRNQKKNDSATKKRRFRNQEKAILQPKQEEFASKKRPFPNHHPHNSETNIRVTIAATLNMASSPDAGGWGGVGWDNNVLAAAFLPLTHLRPHSTWHRRPGSCVPSSDTLAATLNMASSPDAGGWAWVGVGWGGWDNNVLAAAFLPLTHLWPHSTWHRLQMRWGWVGWGGIITSWQLRSFLWHTCSHTQHGIVSRCGGVGLGGVGWGGIITSWQLRSFLWHTCSHTQHGIVSRCGGWGGVGWDNNVLAAAFLPFQKFLSELARSGMYLDDTAKTMLRKKQKCTPLHC